MKHDSVTGRRGLVHAVVHLISINIKLVRGVYRPMLDSTQQQALVTRLNRIEGQVRGIRRMVEEPRLCVEILQQLAAAEAALNRISLAVVKAHVEKCVPAGIDLGETERKRRLDELVAIFDRFSK